MTFAPVTPNTSGTIVATDAEGRVDETDVIEVLPALMGMDVGAQALPGTWTTEMIAIQNLGSSPATVAVELYNGGASPAQTISPPVIPVLGNTQISSSAISSGKYGAVVSSSEMVAVAVLNRNNTSKAADLYAGMHPNTVSSELYAPTGTRLWGLGNAWNSMVHIQNVSNSAQGVRLDFYPVGTTTAIISKEVSSLAPYESVSIDLGSSEFNPVGAVIGWIKITGLGGGAVAAVVEQYRNYNVPTGSLTMMTPAVPRTMASSKSILTVVTNNWGTGKWQSAVNILNMGDQPTNVTAVFKPGSPYSVGGKSFGPFRIGPREVYNMHLAEKVFGYTANFLGSCELTTDNGQPILAVVTTNSYDKTGAFGQSWVGNSEVQAFNKLAAPIIFRGYQGWTTATQIYNFGSTATVRMRFIKSPQCTITGWDDFTWDQTISNNSSGNYHMNERPGGSVPQGWYGAAYIETVPSDPNAKLVAVVTNSCYGITDANAAAAYPAVGY